jgi:alkylation response protein AidB-like acyl-CoA dehydrogenase
MKTTNLRVLATAGNGNVPVAESSMLKIRGTEIRQEIASLTRRALGPFAQRSVSPTIAPNLSGEAVGSTDGGSVTADYLNLRTLSIFGGSSEIQREIIVKAILEL